MAWTSQIGFSSERGGISRGGGHPPFRASRWRACVTSSGRAKCPSSCLGMRLYTLNHRPIRASVFNCGGPMA
eukprot:629069-Prorocentrum_lima.AAC.1